MGCGCVLGGGGGREVTWVCVYIKKNKKIVNYLSDLFNNRRIINAYKIYDIGDLFVCVGGGGVACVCGCFPASPYMLFLLIA